MQPHRSRPSSRPSWVVPTAAPAPTQRRAARKTNSEPPAPKKDRPTAAPSTLPFQQLMKRRLPFLLASAAGALFGSSSGGGFLSSPLHHPLAAAHAATPSPPPTPLLLLAGVTANSPAKPAVLLLPIGKIEAGIDEIGGLLKDPDQWPQALDKLAAPPFTKAEFKKLFNAYSDTIYYATSPNGYTANPPSSQQSIQYLYRNEILTNLEELREELQYLITERGKGSEGDWGDRSGLDDYWGRAKGAMSKYLSLAPPEDVDAVREAVANQRKQAPVSK